VGEPVSLVTKNVGPAPELKIDGNRLVGVYPVSFLLDLFGVCILPCVQFHLARFESIDCRPLTVI
jgi:hypothetical protein